MPDLIKEMPNLILSTGCGFLFVCVGIGVLLMTWKEMRRK
jgi:hypothetical protein